MYCVQQHSKIHPDLSSMPERRSARIYSVGMFKNTLPIFLITKVFQWNQVSFTVLECSVTKQKPKRGVG